MSKFKSDAQRKAVMAKYGKKSEPFRCMDCGKPIREKKQAPSGSMIPRCSECNSKRWKQHYASESEQLGTASPGLNTRLEDEEYYSRNTDW